MPDSRPHFALEPIELPRLSDSTVIEVLDLLNEFVARFENHYGVQIRRFYDLQLDTSMHPPVPPDIGDDEVPF